jgi:hypothetical protein
VDVSGAEGRPSQGGEEGADRAVGRDLVGHGEDRLQFEAAVLTPSPWDEGTGLVGAACRNRTDDLLITSEMLYRLS